MEKRKRKLIDRILLIATPLLALLLFTYWAILKRPDRNFYLHDHTSGWVKISYEVPGAPPLKQEEGVYKIDIPPNKEIVTSSAFKDGWGRDRFFHQQDGQWIEIPKISDTTATTKLHIHEQTYAFRSHMNVLTSLSQGTDTTLADGTRIKKQSGNRVSYQPGREAFEYFYFSSRPQPIEFQPPERPKDPDELVSTEDGFITVP